MNDSPTRIVVVGGGVLGVSTAAHLVQHEDVAGAQSWFAKEAHLRANGRHRDADGAGWWHRFAFEA